MPLELTIVTADKRFHYENVAQVVIPTPQGQLGLLPGHVPLLSLVTCGVLRIFLAGPDKVTHASPRPILFALSTGMARLANDLVVLLMNEACHQEEIDPAKTLSRSNELALARTSQAPLDLIEKQELEEETAFTDAQLTVLDLAMPSKDN